MTLRDPLRILLVDDVADKVQRPQSEPPEHCPDGKSHGWRSGRMSSSTDGWLHYETTSARSTDASVREVATENRQRSVTRRQQRFTCRTDRLFKARQKRDREPSAPSDSFVDRNPLIFNEQCAAQTANRNMLLVAR